MQAKALQIISICFIHQHLRDKKLLLLVTISDMFAFL